MKEQGIYFRPALGQTFPDFYLSEDNERNLCEMKTYLGTRRPVFDISNFLCYSRSMAEHPYRLDSDYLIFAYESDKSGNISIKEMWCKKVWQITGPATEYPLNCQRRNGQIVNIRPVSWMSRRSSLKPYESKEAFLAALYKTHLSYTNQTRVSREWLNQIISGYQQFSGEDMTLKINGYIKKRGINEKKNVDTSLNYLLAKNDSASLHEIALMTGTHTVLPKRSKASDSFKNERS